MKKVSDRIETFQKSFKTYYSGIIRPVTQPIRQRHIDLVVLIVDLLTVCKLSTYPTYWEQYFHRILRLCRQTFSS